MQLSLPYPPSANRLWRYDRGRRPHKSDEYKSWLAEAHVLVRAQRPVLHKGSFRATILVDRPDRRGRDQDNLVKPIYDLLKQAGVIEDDRLAQSTTIAWAWETITPGGAVSVTIEPAEFPIFLIGRAA